MPTRPKPADVLADEKKSHRTKAELAEREKAEKSVISGEEMKEHQEVKNNKVSHKEFLRLKKILKNINKNDAIYERIINRYCIIIGECSSFEEKREAFYKNMQDFESKGREMAENGDITIKEYYNTLRDFERMIINIDKQIQAKRKMLMDIEKENVMTIASALRSIPKKAEKKKSAIEQALNG